MDNLVFINPQIDSLVRSVLTAAAGYFVGTGILDASTATVIVSAIVGIASAVWGIMHKNANPPAA